MLLLLLLVAVLIRVGAAPPLQRRLFLLLQPLLLPRCRAKSSNDACHVKYDQSKMWCHVK